MFSNHGSIKPTRDNPLYPSILRQPPSRFTTLRVSLQTLSLLHPLQTATRCLRIDPFGSTLHTTVPHTFWHELHPNRLRLSRHRAAASDALGRHWNPNREFPFKSCYRLRFEFRIAIVSFLLGHSVYSFSPSERPPSFTTVAFLSLTHFFRFLTQSLFSLALSFSLVLRTTNHSDCLETCIVSYLDKLTKGIKTL